MTWRRCWSPEQLWGENNQTRSLWAVKKHHRWRDKDQSTTCHRQTHHGWPTLIRWQMICVKNAAETRQWRWRRIKKKNGSCGERVLSPLWLSGSSRYPPSLAPSWALPPLMPPAGCRGSDSICSSLWVLYYSLYALIMSSPRTSHYIFDPYQYSDVLANTS